MDTPCRAPSEIVYGSADLAQQSAGQILAQLMQGWAPIKHCSKTTPRSQRKAVQTVQPSSMLRALLPKENYMQTAL